MRFGSVILLSLFLLAKETHADDSPTPPAKITTAKPTPRVLYAPAYHYDLPSGPDYEMTREAVCPDFKFTCGGNASTLELPSDVVLNSTTLNATLSQCIPKNWVCDGRLHCDDKSDEIGCKDLKCREEGTFPCQLNEGDTWLTCIDTLNLVDFKKDCFDGTDENFKKYYGKRKCEPTEFDCGNGQCTVPSNVCNTIDDCGNNADEEHCDYFNITTPPDPCSHDVMFDCGYPLPCIPIRQRCDRYHDCNNGRDEQDCEGKWKERDPQDRDPLHDKWRWRREEEADYYAELEEARIARENATASTTSTNETTFEVVAGPVVETSPGEEGSGTTIEDSPGSTDEPAISTTTVTAAVKQQPQALRQERTNLNQQTVNFTPILLIASLIQLIY